MLPSFRRWTIFTLLAISFVLLSFYSLNDFSHTHEHPRQPRPARPVDRIIYPGFFKPKFRWKNVKQNYPVDSLTALPTGPPVSIPQIQYNFRPERPDQTIERKRRLKAVEEAFKHSWEGYKRNAWLADEVKPLTGAARESFGGFGATLVDSLDTLYIMGLEKEFSEAVASVKKIDFTISTARELNLFETTIRYLGGLLSAYDVSGHGHHILLQKAVELGEMLYYAFDTPNRMPVTRWDWEKTLLGEGQHAKKHSLLAEVGSLTLEFTRLSQLTGDSKWYDAVARITNVFEECQNHTKIPGLWPVHLDTKEGEFTKGSTFTLGGMADSVYEYLPKQHLLLGGQTKQYQNLYLPALSAAKEHVFFRPLNPENRSLLLAGTVQRYSAGRVTLQPEGEHLSCFIGGMVALGAKIFEQDDELETARQLVDGCGWAADSTASGILPELFSAVPCSKTSRDDCSWDEVKWQRAVVEKANHGSIPEKFTDDALAIIRQRKLAPGITEIRDARYMLRPEFVESLFVLYRITGDPAYQHRAWELFQATTKATRTAIAYAALKDVTQSDSERELLDNMESYWPAETLKYFYLIFSEPHVVSLDEFVFTTEAHPLLRPRPTAV